MTRQEAREELENYKTLLKKIGNYRRRLEELQTMQNTCRISVYNHEPKMPRPYRQEELIDKIERVERDYQDLLSRSIVFMHKIERRVERLKGSRYTVIHSRYIENKKRIEIAFKLNMSIEWVRRNEYKGLDEYASLTEE